MSQISGLDFEIKRARVCPVEPIPGLFETIRGFCEVTLVFVKKFFAHFERVRGRRVFPYVVPAEFKIFLENIGKIARRNFVRVFR